MPFADTQGAQTHYVLEGATRAPALVLSNSLGTDLSMWDPQMPTFQSVSRLLRYDTRGHGKSAATPGDYSIEMLGRDVISQLDQLALGRVDFCGLSMGGMIGMWIGVHAPERLRKLVLCNTAPKIGTTETWNARIGAVRKGGMEAIASAVIDRWFSPAFRTKYPEAVAKFREMLERANPAGYASCCAAVRDFDFRKTLSAIRLPTLVIAGAYDPVTPPSDGQFLADHIPEARYRELAAAHLSNIEDQDHFTAAVCEFLGT